MIKLDSKAEKFYRELLEKGYTIKQLTKNLLDIDLKAGAIFTKKPDSELKYLDKKVYESIGNNPAMSITFVGGAKPIYILPVSVVDERPKLFVEYNFNKKE